MRTASSILVLIASIWLYYKLVIRKDLAPIVSTKLGPISGLVLKSYGLGRNIYAYRGVPYAMPPTGKLRFRKPAPVTVPWINAFEAFDNPPVCFQPNQMALISEWTGQEDCLYLNVYVPLTRDDQSGLLPVMVMFPGGGFTLGDIGDGVFGPHYLLDKDVIMVSVQYRVGPLGFLNLGDERTAAGNQGLWDQRLALQWVKDNIEAFRGDPDKVTIFGESAGGTSVASHLLRGEKGLFQRAISQSGTLDSAFGGLEKGTYVLQGAS